MNKLKSFALWLVIGVLGVGAIGSTVKADGGFSWESVHKELAQLIFGSIESSLGSGEPMLGASGTRLPNGISADSTSPSAGEVRGTTLTITGAASITGDVTVATSSASTTLGLTPNQVNVARVPFSTNSNPTQTGTTTYCSVLNNGADRVVSRVFFDVSAAPNQSTASGTITFGVSSTPAGVAEAANYARFEFATSTAKQVYPSVNTTSLSRVLWTNGQYFTAISSATSTQTGACIVQYTLFE